MDFNYAAIPDGAVAHRNYYRGKDLTYAFNDGTFSANVRNGTFRDIFPGDYIVKKITVPARITLPYPHDSTSNNTYQVKFVIADLDLAMNHVSLSVTNHHVVIVPERPVFYACMNPSETNAGGYTGSYMHRTVMLAFSMGLSDAFGSSHLLKFNADGQSCTCRLMTLSMVFGLAPLPQGGCSWSSYIKDNCMGVVPLAAFSLYPDLRGKNMGYWVSDLPSSSLRSSSSCFTALSGSTDDDYADGVHATYFVSKQGSGVRPFALLV